MDNNIVVGTDIGGSHITAALIDLDTHSIIRKSFTRRHVNAKGSADDIIKEWTAAINNCLSFSPGTAVKIGMAMPGPFDYEKGICLISGLDKFESMYKLNIKSLLANELNIRAEDIFLMNDASCFLKGEVFAGAAANCNNVIGITLGTGLGSAFFKDGVVYDGDLYYTPYLDATAEDYLSTRWFIREYKTLTGATVNNVKELRDRIPVDETPLLLFKKFGTNLGRILANYIKKQEAKKVVISGNIINAWDLFMDETKKVLNDHSIDIVPVKAMLGEEAALMGAGSLCV